MVFSSLLFLFAFMAVTLLLYYIMPNNKLRNWVLFILSLIFYGWGEPLYIVVMLLSIAEAFFLGFFIAKYNDTNIKRARVFLVLSLGLNLLSLLFFKYCNFFIENLSLIPGLSGLSPIEGLKLPIGISFYTFQIMSYTIDLYWKRTGLQRNFVAFGAYVTLFPQLIAGPIVRYRDVDDQLSERRENIDLFASGVRRFITIGTGLPDDLNVYALSKAKFADVLKWYASCCALQGNPISVCNVELENFYGEDEPTDRFLPGTVAKLKRNETILLTAGTQIRDFVYVEDVLDNLMALVSRQDLPEYLDLPLGSGEGVSIWELVTYLKEMLHSDSQLCFGAVPSRMNEPDSVADRETMQRFGVSIRYGWKEGMKKFL